MGLIAVISPSRPASHSTGRPSLTTGILGGYTTFSAFSLDVALLYERGDIGLAALYVLISVLVSIAGLFGGLALVRNFV